MKTIKRKYLFMPLITILIFSGLMTGSSLAQEEEIITGDVKAVQWLDEGEVIAAVLVVTSNEEDEEGKLTTYIDEYTILDDRMGKELFKLEGETVEVVGTFLEEDDGTVYLKVKSFKIVESLEENLDEEDPNEDYPNEDELEEPPK